MPGLSHPQKGLEFPCGVGVGWESGWGWVSKTKTINSKLYYLVPLTGLSTRAGSRPKPPASQPSLAGYFRFILPVLLTKNRKNTILEACKASVSQFELN